MQGVHKGCPPLLGDQGHGRLVDVDAARQARVAARVVEDLVVALA